MRFFLQAMDSGVQKFVLLSIPLRPLALALSKRFNLNAGRQMNTQRQILYAREPSLTVEDFRRVLQESGLGATRPINDEARLQSMLAGANFIVTARLDQPGYPLVGVARGVTDFSWCCYLSELAVSASAQRLGIGKGLLDAVRRELGPAVSVILISMPDAVEFYKRVGMASVTDAFWSRRER
jgi:ribosomal protein S18 acetylase RimI-like enzyme